MAKKYEPRYSQVKKTRSLTKDLGVQEDAWVEQDLDENWRIALRLSTTEGTTIVSELRVIPAQDYRGRKFGEWKADTDAHGRYGYGVFAGMNFDLNEGVTGRLLRRIKVGAYLEKTDEFQADMRKRQGKHGESGGAGWARDMTSYGFQSAYPEAPRRERRKGLTDLQFARLAKQYVTRVQKGSFSPVKEIAKTRKEDIKRTRDLLHKARRYGFLTKVKQGSKGGELTTKSFELLKERSRK